MSPKHSGNSLKMSLRNIAALIPLIALSLPQALSAGNLWCERYSVSGVKFMSSSATQTQQDAFDEWMPETLLFQQKDIDAFENIPGSNSILFARKVSVISLGKAFTQKFQLLPNKKMMTAHPQGNEVSAKYKCDKGPSEVLVMQSQKPIENNQIGASGQNGTSKLRPELNKAKNICSELGFVAGTEKYGDCVLKLIE
jgi:hypothetical protein